MVCPAFAQWEPEVQLSHSGKATIPNTWSMSASFGGIVHVVWSDTRNKNAQIYYRRSQDNGINWKNEKCMTNTSGNAENAVVSVAGVMNPVTHIVWDDDQDGNKEIYYKRSSDWGITWSQNIRLTNAPDSSVNPAIHGCVCCGSDVRIVWVDKRNGNADVFYKYSADNGITWSDDIQITNNQLSQLNPTLTFCRDQTLVAWTDFRNGQAEIWGRRSTDCGKTWEKEIRLSNQAECFAAFPTIAHVDSSYYLFWVASVDSSKESCFDIFYKRTKDLGVTWEPDIRLTNYEMLDSFPYPSCTALGPQTHVSWVHPENGIYYKRSTDHGATWENDTCLVSPAETEFFNPSIAVPSKYVHMVWFNKHEGKTDIFYKHNPTGNPILSE